MSKLKLVRPTRLWLKQHPELTEQWLQDQIAADPSILGLGDLLLLDRERRQERAGRLDLLLTDTDLTTRYEVELMLGATDESHIIRCIEYWDIERRRYPGYDHVAVLVAEDITTRFLNLLSLFAGTLPLMAIQLNALRVGSDQLVLDFVRVLDQRSLRRDDEAEAAIEPVDRSYWMDRKGNQGLALADELLAIINEQADPPQQLNYGRAYIGLSDGVRVRNFITFRPRKQHVHMGVEVEDAEGWSARLDEVGLTSSVGRRGRLRLPLAKADLDEHRELVSELLHEAVARHQG